MGIINKTDFYCGAFVTYLVSNKFAPTLFDGTDNSKISKFIIGSNDYKVYIKYSTTCNLDKKGNRRWAVSFTEKELSILTEFSEEHCKTYIIVVCTDNNLSNTEIAVLDYSEAMKCLGNDEVNEFKRISLTHLKGSKYILYYGTAVDSKKGFRILRNFESYFKQIDNNTETNIGDCI